MRRNWFKYLLVVTTVGWIYTFLTLINQLNSYQELTLKLDSLKQQHAALENLSKKLPQSGLEHNSNAKNGVFERSKANKYQTSVLKSQHQAINLAVDSNSSQFHIEVLRELSSSLMNLQNDVLEVQYFLSRRRKGWSSSEKTFMDDLVKYLWFEVHNSRNKLVKEFCSKTLLETSEEILQEISKTQNERDCFDEKNKLSVCHLQQPCGFGCQLHHITWCLILSFGLNRTMVLDDTNWSYSKNGWGELFLPVSKCSHHKVDISGVSTITGLGADPYLENKRIIRIPLAAQLVSRAPAPPQHLPNIPSRWAQNIYHCHSAPIVWYTGHFTYYNTRPNKNLLTHVHQLKSRYNISESYFGLHVRRSDKQSEARFHDLWEYMEFVQSVRNRLYKTEYHIDNHIYLATDEPAVLETEAKNFTDFKFFGDAGVAKRAGSGANRYADGNIIWLLTDMHFLAKSQYIVCTFSSQICRACYELMQFNRRTEDAGWRYQSLDDLYYYAGQGPRFWYAATDHNISLDADKGQLPLRKGEKLKVHGNHWDGYSKITRMEVEGQPKGVVPSFKTKQLPISSFDLGR